MRTKDEIRAQIADLQAKHKSARNDFESATRDDGPAGRSFGGTEAMGKMSTYAAKVQALRWVLKDIE